MMRTIEPGMRTGMVRVPASKSGAHRMLIAAALSGRPSTVFCEGVSKDIAATAGCLSALGADIVYTEDRAYRIGPIRTDRQDIQPVYRHLYCGESGTTLRFMLPLSAALGIPVIFHMEGLLSKRPMGALVEELRKHGVSVHQEHDLLYAAGRLQPGEYSLPGNISSQFISGLLLSLPLLNGESRLTVTEQIESASYIRITEQVLDRARIRFAKNGNTYTIPGGQTYDQPEVMTVESDWSGAAFFLCMGALSEGGVSIPGMNTASCHGDRKILDILKELGAEVSEDEGTVCVRRKALRTVGCENTAAEKSGRAENENTAASDPGQTDTENTAGQAETVRTIDASDIPDLVPVLSVFACSLDGVTRFTHAERLRLKESDRIRTTAAMLRALGADVQETEDGLLVRGAGKLPGGTVDPANDHRIAMSAAVAAGLCEGPVRILDSECVAKSYPAFFEDMERLRLGK